MHTEKYRWKCKYSTVDMFLSMLYFADKFIVSAWLLVHSKQAIVFTNQTQTSWQDSFNVDMSNGHWHFASENVLVDTLPAEYCVRHRYLYLSTLKWTLCLFFYSLFIDSIEDVPAIPQLNLNHRWLFSVRQVDVLSSYVHSMMSRIGMFCHKNCIDMHPWHHYVCMNVPVDAKSFRKMNLWHKHLSDKWTYFNLSVGAESLSTHNTLISVLCVREVDLFMFIHGFSVWRYLATDLTRFWLLNVLYFKMSSHGVLVFQSKTTIELVALTILDHPCK